MLLDNFSRPPLRLLPDAALLVLSEETLLVAADLHLGKSAAFRAHGLPVPEGDTARDLDRLAKLIAEHRPGRLVIAGDLFHADAGSGEGPLDAFMAFLDGIAIPFTLVCGNHDRKIRKMPASIDQIGHLDIGGLRIVHKPDDAAEGMANLCGHIHPVLRIPDGRNTSLRMPCFQLSGNILTLPAFGSFTGGHIVKPAKGERFFVTHNGAVIEVPDELLGNRRGGL
jgi:DNA ligase-associated metallophosphoesterase